MKITIDKSEFMHGGFLMDFEAIKKAAQGYQADMTRFLRDMIADRKSTRLNSSHPK